MSHSNNLTAKSYLIGKNQHERVHTHPHCPVQRLSCWPLHAFSLYQCISPLNSREQQLLMSHTLYITCEYYHYYYYYTYFITVKRNLLAWKIFEIRYGVKFLWSYIFCNRTSTFISYNHIENICAWYYYYCILSILLCYYLQITRQQLHQKDFQFAKNLLHSTFIRNVSPPAS